MSKKNYRYIFFVTVCILGYLSGWTGAAVSGEDRRIAVVVSKKIRPYMNVLDGMTQGLKKTTAIRVFFLSGPDPKQHEQVAAELVKGRFDLFAAIGPEATKLMWKTGDGFEQAKTDLKSVPKIFTAVLDPGSLRHQLQVPGAGLQSGPCGISLRIPVDRQVREIVRAFVDIKRIGLLFDARHNNAFYKIAGLASQKYGISLIPLRVESMDRIPGLLAKNWQNIDCVWMIPDQTVISEKIIQYIIRLGIYHRKGVIGYNSFFIRSGAVFSFDFDYTALGRQTAGKIETYFETGVCTADPPEFKSVINRKMADKIGFQVRE